MVAVEEGRGGREGSKEGSRREGGDGEGGEGNEGKGMGLGHTGASIHARRLCSNCAHPAAAAFLPDDAQHAVHRT